MTGGRGRGGARQVVVVESPAKARTLRKLLDPRCRVFATRGHVSDLPAKAGSVRPEDGFAMVYETGKGARRTLGAVARALEGADRLVLATDPDREGEAIAWQVWRWLDERGVLDGRAVHRVAFHEVTAAAVRAAMARPRALDMDLVRAQQARRALDYLVGFGLSPVLWRKAPGCRSAGRVQSVALRLICAREAEIEAFAPRAYWSVEAEVKAGAGVRPAARPVRLDGAPLERLSLASAAAGEAVATRIRAATFTVAAVERATVRREPNPPFTTATLQQEAARRLGFTIRRTMELAQALYEGIELGTDTETEGLITYMRTDSVTLSKTALAAARRTLRGMFAPEYLRAKPRLFRARRAGVQEAHEAIRPTDFARTPESLEGRLEGDAARLYALIWRRALASQMAAARFERVDVELASAPGDIVLAASTREMTFDGHLRLYGERAEEPPRGGGRARELVPGEAVRIGAVRSERRTTAPPPRYTEAALVRRLEELGIGRPSTWAAIVGVLRDRQYVALANREFVPLERGRVATAFLERFFARWVDYGFTAGLEADLDRVAGGTADRDALLGAFWAGFDAALQAVGALERQTVVGAIEAALAGFVFGPGGDSAERRCPACGTGTLGVRAGRRGLFVGCGGWPECGYRRPLAAAAGDGGYAGPKPLGDDPATGVAVTLRRGPNGWYVQRDDSADGAKAERMSVPRAMDPEDIALDTALALLALPREVGTHPQSGEPILAGIGRYGPWLRHRHLYAAIPDDDDVLTIGINRAVHLVTEKEVRDSRARGPKRVLREVGSHPDDGAPVWLKTGHYGPFVAHRRRYASLPEDVQPESLTLEQALELLGDRAQE